MRRFHFFSSNGKTLGLGLAFTTRCVGFGNLNLGEVLTLYRDRLSIGNLNPLLSFGVVLSDFTISFLLSNTHLRFIDCPSSSFFTQGLNIARFIRDILNIHVNEPEPDLGQFHLNSRGDFFNQKISVCVNRLNIHGGDHDTHLTKDNVLPKQSDLVKIKA